MSQTVSPEWVAWAKILVQRGSALLKEHFRHLTPDQIEQKTGPNDLVTDLDKEVEKMYAEAIQKAFPTHGIFGEEGARKADDAEYVWVMDPLDGTTNYVRGIPIFCTILTLLRHKVPVFGLIAEPMTGDLYTAIQGEGSFCNQTRIHASSISASVEASIIYCHGRASDPAAPAARRLALLRSEFSNLIRFRSAGCEMAMVASGRAEAYFLDRAPLWDVAAGALLVQEAGGRATTFIGEPWRPTDDLGKTDILVSNGTALHDMLLKIVKKG